MPPQKAVGRKLIPTFDAITRIQWATDAGIGLANA
jgi:hypothetical protein